VPNAASKQIDFPVLVDELGDYLYNYAKRYFRDDALAEDLVQETFLAAVRTAEGFRGESSPKTWLVSILRHKIIDQIRSQARARSADLSQAETETEYKVFFGERDGYDDEWTIERSPMDWTANPQSVLEQKAFVGALQQCLSNLSERLRQIFLLREIEDCLIADIAAQLGMTETNVRVTLHRARVLLRDCIELSWLKAGST
jgi:RNA polymerase sigma-70 factor, ECF subfamily